MGRIKRIFRTRYKICNSGVISHITQRAPGRELLFLEKADYLFMLHLIKETVEKFSLEMFSFVLMPNHVHFALRTTKDNLSNAMKNLFERYANYFNGKYERKGHVFCGAYRQAVCLDESYLFAITVYIHINPVKAGLVVDSLDYPWSSIRPYIMSVKREPFLNYHFILDMLSENTSKAREIYRDLLVEALPIKIGDVFEHQKSLDLFRSAISRIINKGYKAQIRGIDIFDLAFETKIEELKNRKYLKNPQEIEAKKYLIQQLRSRGYKTTEIAKKLGVSRRSLYL